MIALDDDTGTPFDSGSLPPSDYDRPVEYDQVLAWKDVAVPMRDGNPLICDIYYPESTSSLPVLLAFGPHSKEIQGPVLPQTFPAQPAWSAFWVGHMEAGDTRYFVSRGYIHIVASPRGFGKSPGAGSREWDCYDLIGWISRQPWCNGQVGMIGIGAFAAEQFHAAKQKPAQLKAIFPYDPRGALGALGGFREEYPGGVLHAFRYLMDHFTSAHATRGVPGELSPEQKALWQAAIKNPDYLMYSHLHNVLTFNGQHMPRVFEALLNPYDDPISIIKAEAQIQSIDIPTYTGAGWYGYTYKTHLLGAQNYYANLRSPKRAIFLGPAPPDRPLRALRQEMLRWFDHWLKHLDTGMMDEPPVKYWLMGANRWICEKDWPPAHIRWTKLYLHSWERLLPSPHLPGSNDEFVPADSFLQMPPTQTNKISGLRYLTEPLGADVEVTGPMSLTLYAEIDQSDTNWIIVLKDVGPDEFVHSAREGEREFDSDLPEREVSRGWLKASNRALDPQRSLPGRPWHILTRDARQDVVPGEINEYVIEIMPTANLFRKGHRISVEITSLDLPSGISGATNVEYIPYHICSSKTTVHRIYHDASHPSHLLLPVVPATDG